ncbi:transcription regulator [Artemisia annua]|uniref:Transcription regulator n=1 Tax=Artemisia annua TaxID=35608 RepID=A0A2U1M1W6_ARTAN|nr:transcription regulator [Artemisia annua]
MGVRLVKQRTFQEVINLIPSEKEECSAANLVQVPEIDLLAEISQSPRNLSEVDAALKAKQMKTGVDEYLKTRPQGTSFLTDLKQKLLLSPSEAARAGT